MNWSWKPSVMKVHCEEPQFWLCGLKTYLPPKLPEYAIGGPNRFQGLSHRDQYAADLQEAGRRSLQEQEGPRPGCSHWDPTTQAQAPSPTTPSTAALPGSTSQQQAALAPASAAPKAAATLLSLLARVEDLKHNLLGKVKVLEMVMAGADFVKADQEEKMALVEEMYSILSFSSTHDSPLIASHNNLLNHGPSSQAAPRKN